jgi:hypothetical protein
LEWLQQHLDYVVRIDKGTCVLEPDGRCWKLGQEPLRPGEVAFHRRALKPDLLYCAELDLPRMKGARVVACSSAIHCQPVTCVHVARYTDQSIAGEHYKDPVMCLWPWRLQDRVDASSSCDSTHTDHMM